MQNPAGIPAHAHVRVVALFFLVSFCLCFPALAQPKSTTQFWVAPNAPDGGDGSEKKPFRTLEQARDAARNVSSVGEIVISLKDGTYQLSRTLLLAQGDSGRGGHDVVYRAAPGAHPVISGAARITGWSLHDKALNIYKASARHGRSRQFYVNGQRATRARTPLYLPGFTPEPTLPQSAFQRPYVISGAINYTVPTPAPAGWIDPSTWHNVKSIEAVGLIQWKMNRVPLASIQPGSGTGQILLQQPGWTNANIYFDPANPTTNQPEKPGLWSFWRVAWFENAYEFLQNPGDWYLDESKDTIYYIPRAGEDMATADAELPVVEVLIDGQGQCESPVSNLRFEGLTFAYATWLDPSSGNGYVADQSGFRVVGNDHLPNVIGHDQNVVRSQGNLRFTYGRKVIFRDNTFEHMGGVALDFGTGSQENAIERNTFNDISSAAIQLGGVSVDDHHPPCPQCQITHDNVIADNTITGTGKEYADSAAIFAGFTRNTRITHNTISDAPWAGIAMGWGWGLLDKGMFPGVSGAARGQWGTYTTPTPSNGNQITYNRISNFLNVLWDGGSIYTTGQQGLSMQDKDALLIEGNVASGRGIGPAGRAKGGGNVFYTDGGSRYVKLKENASFDNPIGNIYFGPSIEGNLFFILNKFQYGSDSGGCRTYGDIHFEENYWLEGKIPGEEFWNDLVDDTLIWILSKGSVKEKFFPYSPQGFFDVCPYSENGMSYPTGLSWHNNHDIQDKSAIPERILKNAGARTR